MDAITVQNLYKVFPGGEKALNGISMSVKEGEIFTLLGRNGAGKSTLINILTTLMRPTSGKALLFGKDALTEPYQIRQRIACVAQKTSVDNHLTFRENMLFQSSLFGIDKKTALKRTEELSRVFNLRGFSGQIVRNCPGGIKRRMDIALAMISSPGILFLDEPTVSLDIESRRAVWEMIYKIRSEFGTTVFLTTHYMEEAEALSDTVCFIKEGREIIQDSAEKLKKQAWDIFHRIAFNVSEPALENIYLSLIQNNTKEVN